MPSTAITARLRVPPWYVVHVPHDSTVVSNDVRPQFPLSDERLHVELHRMTDWHTFIKALVIDVHSYPSAALPYEADSGARRPKVCIGPDSFHAPAGLSPEFLQTLDDTGTESATNTPYAGALVPMKHYRQHFRVAASMIGTRRDRYIDEATGELLPSAFEWAAVVRSALVAAAANTV